MNDREILEYLRARSRIEPPPALTASVIAAIEAAPPHRAWFASVLPVAGALVVLVAAVVLLANQRPTGDGQHPTVAGTTSAAASSSPVFPVVADDPRFAECGGPSFPDQVIAAFPFMTSEREQYFPDLGSSPELQEDAPAFAVVFSEGFLPRGWMRGVGSLAPVSGHTVCVYLGHPPDGSRVFYVNVSITEVPPEIDSVSPMPAPSSTPPPGLVHE